MANNLSETYLEKISLCPVERKPKSFFKGERTFIEDTVYKVIVYWVQRTEISIIMECEIYNNRVRWKN
jgi:hypothetical protein